MATEIHCWLFRLKLSVSFCTDVTILIEKASTRTVVACAELNPRGVPGGIGIGWANSNDVGVEMIASSRCSEHCDALPRANIVETYFFRQNM